MRENAVEVEALVKRFGNLIALDEISFEIPIGSIFGLLGPNGAGKTTAVRILSTILRPDAGRAEVFGHDVGKNPKAVRHHIGLAGQAAAVDPNLTGRENLRMVGILSQLPRREAKRRAGELLERFDLADAADRMVVGYSGGMRRRLDVAAALVATPPVLFLDEPTTGLDVQSRTDLWEVIRELVADGGTVLLTTQYLEEADRLADRIAVVDHGRVIANDTTSVLKSQMGGTVIELGMEDEGVAAAAHRIVSRIVTNHPVQEGLTVRFSSPEGPRSLVGVLRALDANGLAPAALSVREPSLDDVFLALTGHHAALSAGGAAAQPPDSTHREDQLVLVPDEPAQPGADVSAAPKRRAGGASKAPALKPSSRKPAAPKKAVKAPSAKPSGKIPTAAQKTAQEKTAAPRKPAARKSSARQTIAPARRGDIK